MSEENLCGTPLSSVACVPKRLGKQVDVGIRLGCDEFFDPIDHAQCGRDAQVLNPCAALDEQPRNVPTPIPNRIIEARR